MSDPHKMPKLKHLRPMRPDDPFYARGYIVGVVVLGKKSPIKARIEQPKEKG